MKNRRIHFDDRFYDTILAFFLSIGFLIALIFGITQKYEIWVIVVSAIFFLIFFCGIFSFPKMGIYFNYELGIIKYFGPHNIKKRKIKMDEVEKIEFSEIKAEENRGIPDYLYNGDAPLGMEINHVYGNGKLFKFYIHMKDGDIIEIPYQDLYRALSKLRIQEQLERIRKILKEFNQYIANKKE